MESAVANCKTGICQLLEYPDFLKADLSEKKRKARENIFYVTTRRQVSARMISPFVDWPSTANLLYKLQVELLEYLASFADRTITFKYLKWNDRLSGATVAYIRAKNYRHIRTESRMFSKCLHEADRVILDCPGTSLYEAAAAGLPVLCLCYESLPLQENSRKLFGKSLQTYRTTNEAKHAIRDFLEADPAQYRVRLPLVECSAAQVLLGIQKEDISWKS